MVSQYIIYEEIDNMPRTKEQFAEMRNASNQKIRSAAIRLFAKKDFVATSIDGIAEAAGMSKGMVYRKCCKFSGPTNLSMSYGKR
jgi:hypothetical protein